ncbi:MAG: ATP synthase F0 subunit B [Deltaproteobacteria bacterium]|nr:ATP synthase F0 subunit B [Deltaproteobacteria bacterium]
MLLTRSLALLLCLLASPLWAAGDAHHEGVPVKPIIYAAINFATLLIVLSLALRKPLKEFFSSRKLLISQDIEESSKLKQAAQDKYQDFEQRLKNITQESQSLVEELKKTGELEKAKLLEEAMAHAEALRKNAQTMMNQELIKAKEALKRESVKLASELAEELLRQNFNAEDQKRVVEKYLSKMEALA